MVEDFISKIKNTSVSLEKYHISDPAWTKENAITAINAIMKEPIGIIGGDVYEIEGDYLKPQYDYWTYDGEEDETRENFCLKSKEKALEFINTYPVDPGKTIVFGIVFHTPCI